MLFSWLRNRRRRRLLAAPFPEAWLEHLRRNVPLYALLSDAEQAALCDDLRLFVAEKHWEGCGGLALTDEVRVTIAAQACLLLLGIDRDSFDHVHTILVYPSGFRSPEGWAGPDGVVRPDTGLLGQAWYRGPVILAWDSVLAGGRDAQGRNVVLHEFAHQLDFLDGLMDGTPPLHSREQYRRWQQVMTAEYARLVAEAEHGRPRVLDAYGATDPAEFFAVATECFFEKPVPLRQQHPQLYDVLRDYYRQDPVRRFASELHPDQDHGPPPVRPRRRGPSRASQLLQQSEALQKEADDWPGWVRGWGFHPGWTRARAQVYLDRHLLCGVILLLLLGLDFLGRWRWSTRRIALMVLLALLSCSAVWLLLVLRWIDRHGRWAGQPPRSSPPAEALQSPEDGPAAN
jgi:Mlc titration factor MtfA (ptsG expression regulator)